MKRYIFSPPLSSSSSKLPHIHGPHDADKFSQWQTQTIKNDLRQASRKAAKAWNKECRKQAKQQRRGKRRTLFAFKRPAKASKGKKKETTRTSDTEAQPSEKQARSAAIKARIAAVRAKAQRKKGTSESPEAEAAVTTADNDAQGENVTSAQQQDDTAATTKKSKRGRAAGAAAILFVPCFAIAERVKHRKTTRKEPTNETPSEKGAASNSRGVLLKQRLISKRDALRQRKASNRKSTATTDTDTTEATEQPAEPVGLETPTDIDEATPGANTEGQTAAGANAATDVEDQTEAGRGDDAAAQSKKDQSVKGKLLAIPAGIAAAIGAVLKKRRDAKEKKKQNKSSTTTTAAASSPDDAEKKPSRFSALQARFKERRSRVSKKKEPAAAAATSTSTGTKPSRTSGLKDWFKELKQKRKAKRDAAATTSTKKTKKTKKTKAPKAAKEDKPKSTKEHGAVVGLMAGCVALPVAKAKQIRDKRRKSNSPADINTASSSADVVSGTRLSPVPEAGPEEYQQQRVGTSGSSTVVPSTAGNDRPTTTTSSTYQSPVVEEEFEDPPEELPHDSQYLPGHGQSEVPVRPGPMPETRLGSSDTAVEQTAAAKEEQPKQTSDGGVAGKVKAARAGLGGFVARKRGTTTDNDKTNSGSTKAAEKKKNEPAAGAGEDAPPAGGKFQGLKGGLDGLKGGIGNLKAKRRTGETTQPDTAAAVENEKTKPASDGDDAAAGGRFKSLKESLANIKTKKNGTEQNPSKEKAYKEGGPGFIERLRWVWVMA